MTKKIFQSILLVAGCVLLASLLIIMGFLYDYFGGVEENQLRDELSLAAAAVEDGGTDYLSRLTADRCPPDMDRGRRQRPVRHEDQRRES